MSGMVKVEQIFVIILCLLSGIFSDDNLNCQYLNFNETNSVFNLVPCTPGGSQFTIQSYEMGSLDPFRDDFTNYLTNTVPGTLCASTTESFTIDENTELSLLIYLQSEVFEDISSVDIQITNADGSDYFLIIHVTAIEENWTERVGKSWERVENAKVLIRADITSEAHLAIQYLHVGNSAFQDPQCDKDTATSIPDTTTEITTTDTTTETTITDTTTETTTTDTTTETTTTDTTTETTTTDTTTGTTTIDTTTTDTTTETTTTDTTTGTTTIDTTTTDTTTETTTSDATTISYSNPSNDSTEVWMIMTFVFFLTTIIVTIGSVYLIYLYKTTTLAMKTTLVSSSAAKSTTLPRLAIATSTEGHQFIVGIENLKQI